MGGQGQTSRIQKGGLQTDSGFSVGTSEWGGMLPPLKGGARRESWEMGNSV